MTMDWNRLLVQERLRRPEYTEQPHRPLYMQDIDRLTFSAPFRRLANKTQVHPLYEHDHIHHRLIHSIETASAGRSLGLAVGHWLETENEVHEGQKHVVSGVVQGACLAHDIGNPPFGHSGEEAIGDWFRTQFQEQMGLFGQVDLALRPEFEKFEGNAQGFRLIANLEMYRGNGGMQLSQALLGAFAKYPVTAHAQQSIVTKAGASDAKPYCGLKKFGVFETERAL